MITVEQSQEGGLGTGSSLDASETQVVSSALKVTQVPQKLLNPESGSLADGSKLGGLEVGETKSRKISVLLSEVGKTGNYRSKLWKKNVKTVSEEDEIRIAITKLTHDLRSKCKYRTYSVT